MGRGVDVGFGPDLGFEERERGLRWGREMKRLMREKRLKRYVPVSKRTC